jgi:2-polyprenyl-3-methyl-5-hydroxy-6-metoxy-1,4-benzoquinol methylase
VSDRAGEYYRHHHTVGRRYGFTISGDARACWFRREIERLAGSLRKSPLDILDVGCRDGTLTKTYAKGQRVKGLDIDPEAVERANLIEGFDVQKHDLNLAPLPFSDEAFDIVVAGEVIEHLQFPDAVVAEIRRVLRPGGIFIGSVPNAFRLRNRILFLLGRDYEVDPTHLHQFSATAMHKLLSGFREVEIQFQGGHRRQWYPALMATQMHWVARR